MRIKANLLSVCSLLFLTVACGQRGPIPTQTDVRIGSIVGGQKVSENEFSSVAALTLDGRRFCSANLIASNKVSTAAHCFLSTQFGSQAEAQEFAKQLDMYINILLGENAQIKFLAKDKSEKRKLIKDVMKLMMQIKAIGTGVYFGQGAEGGMMEGKKIIKDISFSDAWIEFNLASIAQLIPAIAEESDKNAKYIATDDKVVVTLKEEIKNIKPIPYISADEHLENVLIGEEVELVGFGLKVDARFLAAARFMSIDLTRKIEASKDEEEKKELEEQLKVNKEMESIFEVLMKTSGDKQKVTLKLDHYDHQEMKLRAIHEQANQGACSGDSGGPVFTKLANGELRQLAIMTAVDYCGRTTFAAPVFFREQK